MKNNAWLMLICCLGPLLFFIVAPALGLNKENLSWILIPIILLFCFMMMGKGGGCCGGHERHEQKENDAKQNNKKSCH